MGEGKRSARGEKSGKRKVLHWLNSAKGIGVILVILGHLLYKSRFREVNHYIYAFHMPLFFVISGYVQRPRPREPFLLDKALRLLVPFLCYTLLSLSLYAPRFLTEEGGGWRGALEDAFYLHGRVSNNPLWFLTALFEVYFLFYLFHWVLDHPAAQALFCAAAFGAGYWLYLHKDIEALNTFGINRGVICFGFFLAGMLLRHVPVERIRFWHVLLLPPLLLGGWYLGVALNPKVSFYNFRLQIYPCFVLGALLLSMGVLLLCRLLLDREGPLEYLSRYAILFLGLQYLWMDPFKDATGSIGLHATPTYDLLMLAAGAAYLIVLPLLYELLKTHLPVIKLLNGEKL